MFVWVIGAAGPHAYRQFAKVKALKWLYIIIPTNTRILDHINAGCATLINRSVHFQIRSARGRFASKDSSLLVADLGLSRVPFLYLLFFLEGCVPDRPRGWLARGTYRVTGGPFEARFFFGSGVRTRAKQVLLCTHCECRAALVVTVKRYGKHSNCHRGR